MKVFTSGRFAASAVLFGGLLTASCSNDTPTGVDDLQTITVTPSASLAIGATHQFVAVGRDSDGDLVSIDPTWSVVAGGGTISEDGLFTAGMVAGSFPATVTATSDGLSGSVSVTVTAGPALMITVTPATNSIATSATQQYVAVATDAGGNVVVINPVWSIEAGGGTVSISGLFTAGDVAGTFANTVTASFGGVSGSATATVTTTAGVLATLTISPEPATLITNGTVQFTAVGRDVNGTVLAITPTWAVMSGGGTISATGLFTAGVDLGTFVNTVRVTSGAITGTATVVVTGAILTTLSVQPDPAMIPLNGTQQFTTVGKDANGNVLAITPTWTVLAGGGTISATGLFTAGSGAGTFTNTVQATSGAITATATVIVGGGTLTSISLTPGPATLAINGSQQFNAVGRDANANMVAFTPVWSVVAGGGTISTTGLFTAGALSGTFTNTVQVTNGTVTTRATVTVNAGALATITVQPNPLSLAVTASQQFTVVGRDGNGNVISFTPTWSVVNGGGTISANGNFTASAVAGSHPNTISAVSGAITGLGSVTVTAAPAPAPIIGLGAAATNAALAGTTITCVAGGTINGDVGVSPGTSITGFGPCTIAGAQHANDAAAVAAQSAATNAFSAGFALTCPPANVITGDLGGTTRTAGVYCTVGAMAVTGILTLDGGGNPDASFVFQAGTSLTTAGSISLINGAQARNVFWLVGSSATLGAASQWQGTILVLTSITLGDNATILGRALARNGAVTLGTNNVISLP